jgi:surface polysaccharide O-acyltransferase-like enzyme
LAALCIQSRWGIGIQNENAAQSKFTLPVDLVRTVAILMVLVYHASTENYVASQLNSLDYFVLWSSQTGYQSLVLMGVPLFVILSGALLLQPSKVNEPIGVFFKKRISRILIAFAFWSVIYFAWTHYVDGVQLSPNYVVQSLLNGGAYYQFWFIYLIFGLYLITPILRVIVPNAPRKILLYGLILWFLTVSILPVIHLVTGYSLDQNVLLFTGYTGYFIFGFYAMGTNVSTKTLKRLLVFGVIATIFGYYLMAYPYHALNQYYFFADTLSFNIVLSTIAVYLLLSKASSDWPGANHPRFAKLIHAISENTLPIFFMHVIVLETLNKGLLFGLKISLMQINPIIEIPIAAALTLFICLGLILALKKVPVVCKLIG